MRDQPRVTPEGGPAATPAVRLRRTRTDGGSTRRRQDPWPALACLLIVCLGGCMMRPAAKGPATELEQIRQQIHLRGGSVLSAGAAKVEITPPVGTPLAGYAKRYGKPSIGIHDPLYVRALALSDEEDPLLLISADLLVFPPPFSERIFRLIEEKQKLQRQSIILTTTHTHSGSGSIASGFLYEKVFGPYRRQVEDGIADRISWAVQQAMENRKPVRWGVETDGRLLEGFVENRAAPGGPADPSVSVLLFTAPEMEPKAGPRAVVVNATAHPTLMDSQDLRMSADYPGQLCRRVEEAYPGAVCLFVNGAAGDARPSDAIGATAEERVQRFGDLLAEGTEALINRASLHEKGDLAAWGGWYGLPEPQIHLGPIPIHPEIGRLMRPTSAYLRLAALDNVLLVPLPAELTTDLGVELKLKLSRAGSQPILLGYADGYLGYAVTPRQYESGSYEAGMTWYGAGFGEELLNHLKLLAALYKREESK